MKIDGFYFLLRNLNKNVGFFSLGPGIIGVASGQDVVGVEGAPILKAICVKHPVIHVDFCLAFWNSKLKGSLSR